MINKSDFYLGEVLIEPLRGVVKVGEEERHIEPQIMAVLLRLTADPGKVVTRDEMLTSVWPDCIVNDGVLSKAMSVLRKALGDNARNPVFIQTIPKVGYRLIAPVSKTAPAQMNSPKKDQRRRTKNWSTARSTIGYVLPAVLIILLFMLRPKHVEIEEEIIYRAPAFPVEHVVDSTDMLVDSLSTKKATVIHPVASIESHGIK